MVHKFSFNGTLSSAKSGGGMCLFVNRLLLEERIMDWLYEQGLSDIDDVVVDGVDISIDIEVDDGS